MKTYKEMNDRIVGLLELANMPTTLYAAARIEELENKLDAKDSAMSILGAQIERLEGRRTKHLDYIEELQNLNNTNSNLLEEQDKRIETLNIEAASSATVIRTQNALLDTLQNLAEMQDLAAEKVEKERDEATARGDRIFVDLTLACKQRNDAHAALDSARLIVLEADKKLAASNAWNELYTKRANYYRNLSQIMEANEKDTAILYANAVNEARAWAIHYRKTIKVALEFLEEDDYHMMQTGRMALDNNLDSLNT